MADIAKFKALRAKLLPGKTPSGIREYLNLEVKSGAMRPIGWAELKERAIAAKKYNP